MTDLPADWPARQLREHAERQGGAVQQRIEGFLDMRQTHLTFHTDRRRSR